MKTNLLLYYVVSVAVLLSLCFSCTQKDKPEDILSKEEMVRVLSEVYLAEQKVTSLNLSPDSAKILFRKMQDKLFQKVGIPDSTLRKSYDYYVDHTLELEEIYTALVDSLNLQEQRLNVSAPKEK